MRLFLIPALALLTACEMPVQTTSGAAFLAARGPVDADIAQAAAGEPTLSFPARIGIAKINARMLAPISEVERERLTQLAQASEALGQITFVSDFGSSQQGRDPMKDARLHGAEQHLDYLLVYQPTQLDRGLAPRGRIELAFVDVRSGYVYARASEEISTAGLGTTRIGWRNHSPSNRAAAHLIEAALPHAAEMLNALYATEER